MPDDLPEVTMPTPAPPDTAPGRPEFNPEQVAWLKDNVPPGPFNRLFGDLATS